MTWGQFFHVLTTRPSAPAPSRPRAGPVLLCAHITAGATIQCPVGAQQLPGTLKHQLGFRQQYRPSAIKWSSTQTLAAVGPGTQTRPSVPAWTQVAVQAPHIRLFLAAISSSASLQSAQTALLLFPSCLSTTILRTFGFTCLAKAERDSVSGPFRYLLNLYNFMYVHVLQVPEETRRGVSDPLLSSLRTEFGFSARPVFPAS